MKIGALFSFAAVSANGKGDHDRMRRSDDKTVLGPALVYTKDRLENMISVSSSWSSESRLFDDDSTTYWESDNRFDNEPAITIDFMDDVIINYVDLWPVLLPREKPRDAYAKICIDIQKVLVIKYYI